MQTAPFIWTLDRWFLVTPPLFCYGLICGAVGRHVNKVKTGISRNLLYKVLHNFINCGVFPGYSRVTASFPSGQQVGLLLAFWKPGLLHRSDELLCIIHIMQEPPNWLRPNIPLAQDPSLDGGQKRSMWKKCKERASRNWYFEKILSATNKMGQLRGSCSGW